MKNVIILTVGLSGSSLLTGLVARAGYWTGDTFKKRDYDTYENQELIRLNRKLLEEAEYTGNHEMEFPTGVIERVESLYGQIDSTPYAEFVAHCNRNGPWLWKDPRLWLTIRYWRHFLDTENVTFLVLTREYLQAWISVTIRRQIQTYSYQKKFMKRIEAAIQQFLEDYKLPRIQLCYEHLILRPEENISSLNAFLGTTLTLADLEAIYTKPLRKRNRGAADFLRALLIYTKNYHHRYK